MASQGLTSAAADRYIREHGYNEIVEKKDSPLAHIAKKALTPISGMLFLAAALSFVSAKWFDGFFILALLALNIGITVWQEHKADDAIGKLNRHLAVLVKALRDGAWRAVPSRELAPHDLIELRSGSIVPADLRIIEAHNASANEAALTGESLPKEKQPGDTLYSGSFIASGLLTAEVAATGGSTQFGKTVAKVDTGGKRGSLERTILAISRTLSFLSLAAVVLLSIALISRNAPRLEVLRLDLSLVIAGIPISLPTVMTLIIAFGTIALAKKKVIVRRLAALEELANADFLLTDKTGTLTENSIHVDEILAYGALAPEEVIGLAAEVAARDPETEINRAILAKARRAPANAVAGDIFIPGDSSRKRSTLVMRREGAFETLSLGAPQVIEGLCDMPQDIRARFGADVERLAEHGYRALALAKAQGREERAMMLVGLLSLSDELRPDAAPAIQFLKENGVGVAMVTGDNRAIAREVADKLQMPGRAIVAREELRAQGFNSLTAQSFADTRAFAEILPEDKLALVEAAKKFYTVAANGDGVNDLPAVRSADVGFAAPGAVDALKSAADIVLLSSGIAVMSDAFIEGRKIFARLYSYSLYRISESFRLIVTIAVLGLLIGAYPLSPLQLILLALLNDVPIISLATDRVKIAKRPATLNVRDQFATSLGFGMVGIANSLLLYFLAAYILRLPLPVVQTLFFLKLTVSGHLLIYVAHTRERWWRYLPSWQVIVATAGTQAAATLFAVSGFFMPAPISWRLAAFIWVWALLFMHASELPKLLQRGSTMIGKIPGVYGEQLPTAK